MNETVWTSYDVSNKPLRLNADTMENARGSRT